MRNFLTHDLRKKNDIIVRHDPDPGFLAIVDPGSYEFFAGKKVDWPGMIRHMGRQMEKKSAIAWGCPQKHLRIRIRVTEDGFSEKDFGKYAAAFHAWIRCDGVLWFTSDRDLYFCASDKRREFPGKLRSPDVYCPRKLLLRRGSYSVFVVRHFPWVEGEQHAPALGKGVHFTMLLKHSKAEGWQEDVTSKSHVPWV